jgi:hypothetical protein
MRTFNRIYIKLQTHVWRWIFYNKKGHKWDSNAISLVKQLKLSVTKIIFRIRWNIQGLGMCVICACLTYCFFSMKNQGKYTRFTRIKYTKFNGNLKFEFEVLFKKFKFQMTVKFKIFKFGTRLTDSKIFSKL